MSTWAIYLTGGGALMFALFLLGAPIFVAFLVTIVIGTAVVIGPAGFAMLANSLYDTATGTSLASIPLFILMGELLFRSGTMDVLFNSVDRIIGRVRGRQYVLIVTLSAVFGALSGAAMAVAAMLGRAIMPGIVRRGYDPKLAAGLILGGATLAPIIPPSILAIIIGTLADVSIARLLIAGILPGLVVAGLFFIYIAVLIRIRPSLSPPLDADVVNAPLRQKAVALFNVSPFLLIIFMVMGLIMLGIATPSESAATGVAGAIATAAVYRKLSLRMIYQSLASTVIVSGGVLIIMATSKMFTQLLAFTGATRALVAAVMDLGLDPTSMLFVMLLVPFILCMFVDQIAIMLILVPLFQPLVKSFGFEPTWFWLLFLINMSLGGITPPLGYTIFAFQSVASQLPLQKTFVAVLPFVAIFLVGMFLMVVFPEIVTFLPSLI